MARVIVKAQRDRLPGARLRPLGVMTRGVVVKLTFCETAEAVTAKGAGTVQVTPEGAVPEAMAKAMVTVPVKVLLGVTTMVTEPETPAARTTEVVVLPAASVRVKSGATVPVPVRAEVNGVDDALVTT